MEEVEEWWKNVVGPYSLGGGGVDSLPLDL